MIYLFFIVSRSYLWHLHSTRMKPLVSNNLCKLCSQTAWWSTLFFCATLYIYFVESETAMYCFR